MQTSLRRIASRAAKEREHRFCNLYGLLNEANLKECFQELKKKAAPGVDGVDWHEYEAGLETNLRDLVERLKRKCYRARLVRRKYIEKANGKKRPLGIPVIEDKLLQLAVAKILGAIYEQDFLKSSYGYRPQVGVHDALSTLTRALQYGKYKWVVEADIRGFFDNIDHDLLLRMLERRVNDGALLRLIKKWLKAGILEEDGRVLRPETGTPQGGVVSPVLANIYLHYALDLWFARRVWPGCQGEVRIIRYADDFVCAFERQEEAEGFYQRLGERLEQFGLTLSEEKTRIVKFAAREKADNGTFEFLGIEFRRGINRQGGAQVLRRTSRQKLRASIASFTAWIKAVRHRGIGAIMQTLRSKYRGYWNHYGIRGNFASLQLFYEETRRILKKWLNRRSQRRSYCWAAMEDLLRQFQIPLPHITENTRARQMSFL